MNNPVPNSNLDYSNMPESELVVHAVNGDGAAFEHMMRRHNQLMFRTARSIAKTDTEAEDVVQEAYLKAWRSLSTFRGESKLTTWLVRIATNEALGRIRGKVATVIPLEAAMMSTDTETRIALSDTPQSRPDQVAVRTQVRGFMEARIDQLPLDFRTVFMLRAVEEMSVHDVAQALEIPQATVRTRFFRARSLLRESLARDMDMAIEEAFSFDGPRCDRITANVMERIAQLSLPGTADTTGD